MSKKKPAQATRQAVAAQAGANRRAALRAQQEAAAKKARRNRVLIAVAAVVAVALVIGLVVWAVNRSKPAPAVTPSASGSPTTSASGSPTPGESGSAVAQVTPPDGNSPDLSLAAWITFPSANAKPGAPIVDVHADYQCPYCKVAENTYDKWFEQLSDQGDIVLRQHTRAFLDGVGGEKLASSTRSAVAAACVDVVDNTLYSAYHNALFANQPTEGTGFTDQQLRVDFAQTAGLTGDALTRFQSCFDTQATADWVRAVEANNKSAATNPAGSPKFLYGGNDPLCYDTASGQSADCGKAGVQQAGVLSTPTFFVNGKTFTLTQLFDNKFNPTMSSATDLLAFLQQTANS